MELNETQLDFYYENGYLVLEKLFSKTEIEKLKLATKVFEKNKSVPNVICEEEGEIRSVFAPHLQHESFNWLYKQERLVKPVEKILNNKVYLYQFKLNNKKALTGKFWEWHQDFPYWYKDDGVKLPNMISVMILFHDTSKYQGPLLLLPGSHKNGIADFQFKKHLQKGEVDIMNSLNHDLKYTVHEELLKVYFTKDQIVEATGEMGTCVFFHPNLFHASNSNISPFDRHTAIITYNAIDNLPQNKKNQRPDYLCSRNYNPIKVTKSELNLIN